MKNIVPLFIIPVLIISACTSSDGASDIYYDNLTEDVLLLPDSTDTADIPDRLTDSDDLSDNTDILLHDITQDVTDYGLEDIYYSDGKDSEPAETIFPDPDILEEISDSYPAYDAESLEDIGYIQPVIFDMPMIKDEKTAQCNFYNKRSVLKNNKQMDLWDVTYYSYESINGELQPILIRGYASKPSNLNSDIPGIVQAHGLGGYAEPDHATGLASLLNMFVIAYTGPGGGTEQTGYSEGRPASYQDGYRMFDTIQDVRGSWFWAHSVAAMRAITCLQTRTEINKDKIGMTGFSAGAVATLISSGADDRIKAAVPLSGTLAWDISTESPDAWQHELLRKAGLTTESPQWKRLIELLIAPSAVLANAKAKILMVNGSTDEFFPLTAHISTYNSIAGEDKRTSIAGNFDHGCYKITGYENEKVIEERASLRASGGQKMWFSHWFNTDNRYSYLPSAPLVMVQSAGEQATLVTISVDRGGSQLDVEEIKLWWSNDNSYIYLCNVLKSSGGTYSEIIPFPLQTNTVYFLDVQYKTKDILFPERFSLSSVPYIPQGFIPKIRKINDCQ